MPILLFTLTSLITSSLSVLLFTLPIAAVGNRIARLLGYSAPIFSLSIAYGLFLAILMGYYSYLMHWSMVFIFTMFNLIGFFLTIVDFYHFFKKNPCAIVKILRSNFFKNYFLLFFISIVFFIFNLIILKSTAVIPSHVYNNDIYYWLYNAGQILGQVNLANILPLKALALPDIFYKETIGVNLAIAFLGVSLHKLVFLASPIYLGIFFSWISITMLELLTLLFSLRRKPAIIIALIVTCGAFFQFFIYAFFASELYSIFTFLNLLYISFSQHLNHKRFSFLAVALKLFPLLSLLIIGYQAGFIPFFFAFVIDTIILVLGTSLSLSQVVVQLKKILLSILMAFILAILCYPNIIPYLCQRILSAATGPAGWPFPLFNVFYLFSLPFPLPLSVALSKVFPVLSNTTISFISIVIGLVTMFFLIKRISQKKFPDSNIRIIWSSGMMFTVAILLYLLAYTIKGDIYQVGKFASYTIMPISFIPIAIGAIWIRNIFSKKEQMQSNKFYSCFLPLAAIFALSVSFLIMATHRISGENDLTVFNELRSFSDQLNGVKTLILDLSPYRETMIAFNALSKKYTLIPLNQTYLPTAIPKGSDLNAQTRWITTQKCAKLLGYFSKVDNPSSYAVIDAAPMASSSSKVGGYLYGADGGSCLFGNYLTVLHGLSDPEVLGRWSNDQEVTFIFHVPDALHGRKLKFRFNLIPFLGSTVHSQTVTAFINGKQVSNTIFTAPGSLIVNFSQGETVNSTINLTFVISEIGHDIKMEKDKRAAGILFENVSIETL